MPLLLWMHAAVVCCWLITGSAAAHEYWIEPLAYRVGVDDNIKAHLKVGEHFKGEASVYLRQRAQLFQISNGTARQPVGARSGDRPALNQRPVAEGLNVIGYVSAFSKLTYETLKKFHAFARKEGNAWAIKAHGQRWLPRSQFTEVFRRHAKSLVSVGHGKGEDRALGLMFEWVALDNPYTNNGPIRAQLLWQQQPLAGAQVRVFNRRSETLDETLLTTNADGIVSIDAVNGEFLINSVLLREPPPATQRATGAVWESHWASLTFAR